MQPGVERGPSRSTSRCPASTIRHPRSGIHERERHDRLPDPHLRRRDSLGRARRAGARRGRRGPPRVQRESGRRGACRGELQASSTATTVRTGPDGEPRPTDGPFSEAKEVVGGFYLIEAESEEEAVALAASLAEARQGHGGIEVRPLVSR
ncbi:YciI family protein [Leifsonia sp. L25]|uniref:YciI family protein n=1 Tax=Leifsonia sp. L25 TaxID=3423957 RepID=UPI003D68E97C